MAALVSDPAAWAALLTLTAMEIVLGIDNIVFISVLVARLPESEARRARAIGLGMALVFRLLLLLALTWLIGLTAPLFSIFGEAISWRDIILIAGGLFLLIKGTLEIHHGIEDSDNASKNGAKAAVGAIIVQIAVIDLVFSVDSIVTAIGMAEHIEIMVLAVIIAIGVMYIAAAPVSRFISQHPTTKMLALSFLLLIGVALIADGIGFHIPRGYIYFAMAFSAGVEVINVVARRRRSDRQGATSQ
ncbi:MAG: TerC family protein [Rhodobiaceae bacterium]|nr:TerC family protein [Rhodobiaceae bacterium]